MTIAPQHQQHTHRPQPELDQEPDRTDTCCTVTEVSHELGDILPQAGRADGSTCGLVVEVLG